MKYREQWDGGRERDDKQVFIWVRNDLECHFLYGDIYSIKSSEDFKPRSEMT